MVRVQWLILVLAACSSAGGGGKSGDASSAATDTTATAAAELVCEANECPSGSRTWYVKKYEDVPAADYEAFCLGLATKNYEDYRAPSIEDLLSLPIAPGTTRCTPKCDEPSEACNCQTGIDKPLDHPVFVAGLDDYYSQLFSAAAASGNRWTIGSWGVSVDTGTTEFPAVCVRP